MNEEHTKRMIKLVKYDFKRTIPIGENSILNIYEYIDLNLDERIVKINIIDIYQSTFGCKTLESYLTSSNSISFEELSNTSLAINCSKRLIKPVLNFSSLMKTLPTIDEKLFEDPSIIKCDIYGDKI